MTKNNKGLSRNGSGYHDPTMGEALKSILSQEKSRDKQVHQAITIVKNLLNLWGMSVENRIHIKDKKTGKIYR